MDCKQIKNKEIEHMLETDSDSKSSSNDSDSEVTLSVFLKKKHHKKPLPTKKNSKTSLPIREKETNEKRNIDTSANKDARKLNIPPSENKKLNKSSAKKRKTQNDDCEVKRQKFEKNPPSIKLRLKVDSGMGGRSSWKLSNSESSSSPSTKSQAPLSVTSSIVTCEESNTPKKQSARKSLFSSVESPGSTSDQQSAYITRTPNKKQSNDDFISNNRQERPSRHKEIDNLPTPKKHGKSEVASNKALRNKTPSERKEDEQVFNNMPIELIDENLVNESFPVEKNLFHLTPQKDTRRASKQIADDGVDNDGCDELKKTISSSVNRRTPLKEIGRSPLRYSSRRINSTLQEGSPSKGITSVSNSTLSTTPKRLRSTSISKSNSEDFVKELSDNNTTPLKELNTTHLTPRNLKDIELNDCSLFVSLSKINLNEYNTRNKTPLKAIEESPTNEISSPKDSVSGIFSNKIDCETFTPVKNKIPQVEKTNMSSTKPGDVLKLKEIVSPLKNQEITVTTPVSKKKQGRGFLTPCMAKRNSEAIDTTDNALDVTRKQLHISTVPKYLPCRDAEFSQIKSFLLRKIEHSAGGCMYISGVPGTGKTATVHAVIRALQEDMNRGDLQEFDFVEVNGLRLTEPRQAYVRIYQALTNQKLTADQAQQLLNKRFSSNCKRSTIILVDELDYLCNRRQDVVYNILDWPSKRSSALVVLTISNTMDLPERTLKGRVTSRMGLTRLTFQPYTHHQLKEIVQDRLSGSVTFHPDAVQLVARKVAAVSGDARRALDVCRRTTELVQHKDEQITVSHVEEALVQLCASARVQVIRALSGLGQIVLRSIRDVCQRTGVDETSAASVYQHLRQLTLLEGIPVPPPGAFLETCVNLVRLGLLVAEKGRVDLTRKMSLNVSSDDIHFALDNL